MADLKRFGYVIASKLLVNRGLPVRFMYRENPDNDKDSGWRFFAGIEDDKYADNPDNFGIYDISSVLEIDKTITPYLDASAGMAFERAEGLGRFNVCSSFSFGNEKGGDVL